MLLESQVSMYETLFANLLTTHTHEHTYQRWLFLVNSSKKTKQVPGRQTKASYICTSYSFLKKESPFNHIEYQSENAVPLIKSSTFAWTINNI